MKLLLRALKLWNDSGGMSMSAAVSFYGVLSLAPLLLLLVALLGWWMDRAILEQNLVGQIGTIVGDRGSAVIAQALATAREPGQGIFATVMGLIVLASGASGVFGELQDALERLWSHGDPAAERGWRTTITMKLRGGLYILVLGFLLLVSLAASALLDIFSGWAGEGLVLETLVRVVNEIVGFLFCAALFFGLMRLSTGPKPARRHLVLGAFMAAILFTIGRQLLTIYLAKAAVVSAYGAAGSLIVLLFWMYFSSGALLFGAATARAAEESARERVALGLPEGDGGDDPHA